MKGTGLFWISKCFSRIFRKNEIKYVIHSNIVINKKKIMLFYFTYIHGKWTVQLVYTLNYTCIQSFCLKTKRSKIKICTIYSLQIILHYFSWKFTIYFQ